MQKIGSIYLINILNKRIELIKNLVLLIFTICILFTFAEMTLRFMHYQESRQFNLIQIGAVASDNPILVWELGANITFQDEGVEYKTNSEGLRDYERESIDKDSYKIIILGDSLTYGAGVSLEETYAKILEKKLNNLGDKKYEIFNLGVFGYGTTQECELLKVKGLKYNPNLVILSYVLNDPMEFSCRIKFLNIPISCRLKSLLLQSQFLFFCRNNIRNIFPQEYKQQYSLKLDEEEWERATKPFEELSKISQEKNIPIIVIIFPLLKDFNNYQWVNVHSKIKDISEIQGFSVLDMYDYYKTYKSEDLQINKEDVYHINKQGHEIAANAIFKKLINTGILKLNYENLR